MVLQTQRGTWIAAKVRLRAHTQTGLCVHPRSMPVARRSGGFYFIAGGPPFAFRIDQALTGSGLLRKRGSDELMRNVRTGSVKFRALPSGTKSSETKAYTQGT